MMTPKELDHLKGVRQEHELAKINHELFNLEGDLIDKLFIIEEEMKKYPQVDVPEKFMFSKGVCVKEVILPKDSIIISKVHKHSGVTIISKGDVSVLCDEKEGWKRMQAPCSFESPAGVKRALYIHEETVWANVLATDETDPDKLEEEWVIGSHSEYLKLKGELLCLG
jgi:hypothetical protein